MPLITELLIVLFLVLLNGIFAMSELAVVSSRKAVLKKMAEEGSRRARIALELAEDTGRFLPTVQVGITLVGVFAGAFSGATLSKPLAEYLSQFEMLAASSESFSLAIVVVVITYLSLVIGELAPKQLALKHSEQIALLVAPLMHFVSVIASPMVRFLDFSTTLLMKIVGAGKESKQIVSEDEVKALITEGAETGVFEPVERELITGVMRLADRSIRALITPRIELGWLDINATPEEISEELAKNRYSRFLACDGEIDEVLGVVQSKDVLNHMMSGEELNLEPLIIKAPFVPDSASALNVLETIKQSPVHMVLVLDEYGSLEGIVTATDVLEAIVGEMFEHGEDNQPEAMQRDNGSWLMDGSIVMDKAKDLLNLPALPDSNEYNTLAGFIIAQLVDIPEPGENFSWGGYRFEVVDMDGRRIDKVLIEKLPEEAEDAGV